MILLKTPAAGHRRTPKHQAHGLHIRRENDLLHLQAWGCLGFAGAAGRIHGGCAVQNKPIIAVTVTVKLACQATVQGVRPEKSVAFSFYFVSFSLILELLEPPGAP